MVIPGVQDLMPLDPGAYQNRASGQLLSLGAREVHRCAKTGL
jgi:hypothetical protein